MVFSFNNYFVKLDKDPAGKYNLVIVKITGPAQFDRELIVKTKINSIDSLNEYIGKYIPCSNIPAIH
jgi:hypothetical protein